MTNPLDRLSPEQQNARLKPFFPPHLLSAAALAGPQWLDGTVLVADLTGFSARSAALFAANGQDDHWLLALVNRYFEVVLAESERFGGSPFTFDGDAVSILFTGPQHVAVAAQAALALQTALAGTQVDLPTGPLPLQANMGLSSGPLLSGSFGSPTARVFASLGQAATQAVQAQKLAAGGQIILADSSRAALAGQPSTGPIEPGFYVLAGVEPVAARPQPQPEPAPDLAGSLAAHFPRPLARQVINGDIQTGQRHMAALFVNVDGLGRLVVEQGAGSAAELNHFFGGLRRIIDTRGGLLNKVNAYAVGDKYLVLFGLSALPCADPDRAALETAFELQVWADESPFPLRQRIGLSAGPASECIVGNQRRKEFTAIGRPVNEAVHLMELAGWGQVLAVGDFCREVRSATATQILLKGYAQPTPAYQFSVRKGEVHEF
ncbi:MAG: adenylate/guanylate cyclase domain-containing protein [Chloroflexota bacterium]